MVRDASEILDVHVLLWEIEVWAERVRSAVVLKVDLGLVDKLDSVLTERIRNLQFSS